MRESIDRLVALRCILPCMLLLGGCGGEDPPPQGEELLPNGEACSLAEECSSGFCADDSCCDTQCADACRSCATGTCAPVTGADDDPECAGDTTCDGTGECKRKQGQPCVDAEECASGFCADGTCCDGPCAAPCSSCVGGVCAAVTDGDDVPECAGDTTCDGTGECKKKQGQPCVDAEECASGFCADGTCCDGPCAAPCLSCASGVCVAVTDGDDLPECVGDTTCDSAGECLLVEGGDCGADQECALGFCVDGACCESRCGDPCFSCATGACEPVTDSDDDPQCSGNSTCDEAGACKKKVGQPCRGAFECASGSCADGACCDSDCTDPCFTCVTGACTAVTDADDDPQCTGDDTCDPAGACKSKDGQGCGQATECASGACVDETCCDSACDDPCLTCVTGECAAVTNAEDPPLCADTLACDARGVCKLRDAQQCDVGDECLSAICKDGVCCATECTEPCFTCATGACLAVAAQDDDPECTGDSTCTAAGACLAKVGLPCEAGAECASDLCYDATCCDADCAAPCYTCATGVCTAITDADDDPQCMGDLSCDEAGACKKRAGRPCDAPEECLDGFCKDGVCCPSGCTEPCHSCASGACVPVLQAQDEPECVEPSTCSPEGLCLLLDGEPCAAPGDCLGGLCEGRGESTHCCPTECVDGTCVTGECTYATAVAVGQNMSCALLHNGTVKCWGHPTLLGDDTTGRSSVAVTAPGIEDATAVAVGVSYACVLLEDHTIRCWGANYRGQLGDGTTSMAQTPVVVAGIDNATQVAAGYTHSCAVLADHTVRCWGQGDSGQLGDGLRQNSDRPVVVTGIDNATAVDVGYYHSCALLADHTMRCWGSNGYGQLGDDRASGVQSYLPVVVSGLGDASAITCGHSHTCARLSDGTVRCWGKNTHNELGGGGGEQQVWTPVPVPGLAGVASLDATGDFTCATLNGGTVQCWGSNSNGQLGSGRLGREEGLVTVAGVNTASSVAAGHDHSCVLLQDNAVWCWGVNTGGQLGDGRIFASATPLPVLGVSTATDLDAADFHTCARLDDGTVRCWGSGGRLGRESHVDSGAPVQVADLTNATDVSTGEVHSCAVLAGGSVRCWGSANWAGQLGNGTTEQSRTPVPVTGIGNATAVELGADHSCALLSDRTVKCWGYNAHGQLGGGWDDWSTTPVVVTDLNNVSQLGAGGAHTCALLTDGTVMCWGLARALGNPEGAGSRTPLVVPGVDNITAIAVGGFHTCVLSASGTVQCWGYSGECGQLGPQAPDPPFAPVQIPGIDNATALAAGANHTCVELASGSVRCWGSNTQGQLGVEPDPDAPRCGHDCTACSTTAVTVPGLNGVSRLAGGDEQTCALLPDGTMVCWGSNQYGQLGEGRGPRSVVPVLALEL